MQEEEEEEEEFTKLSFLLHVTHKQGLLNGQLELHVSLDDVMHGAAIGPWQYMPPLLQQLWQLLSCRGRRICRYGCIARPCIIL